MFLQAGFTFCFDSLYFAILFKNVTLFLLNKTELLYKPVIRFLAKKSRPRSMYVVFFFLFFIFSLIFIVINHKTSLKQAHLVFVPFIECLLLFLDDNVDEESK